VAEYQNKNLLNNFHDYQLEENVFIKANNIKTMSAYTIRFIPMALKLLPRLNYPKTWSVHSYHTNLT